jgi:hypothetical protein
MSYLVTVPPLPPPPRLIRQATARRSLSGQACFLSHFRYSVLFSSFSSSCASSFSFFHPVPPLSLPHPLLLFILFLVHLFLLLFFSLLFPLPSDPSFSFSASYSSSSISSFCSSPSSPSSFCYRYSSSCSFPLSIPSVLLLPHFPLSVSPSPTYKLFRLYR